MAKRTITICSCDICGDMVDEGELSYYTLPVLTHYVNEYGAEHTSCVSTCGIEVCPKCEGRLTMLETNHGMVCPVHDESVYKWLDKGDADADAT